MAGRPGWSRSRNGRTSPLALIRSSSSAYWNDFKAIWMALRMNIEEKILYDFLIFTFFKPWEHYEVVLQNSAVPKAAVIASEMVWGSRSTGVAPIF